jgi:hypothetical protein
VVAGAVCSCSHSSCISSTDVCRRSLSAKGDRGAGERESDHAIAPEVVSGIQRSKYTGRQYVQPAPTDISRLWFMVWSLGIKVQGLGFEA